MCERRCVSSNQKSSDETNLNRYALLRRSDVPASKIGQLEQTAGSGSLGGIYVSGSAVRYDAATVNLFYPLAPRVLVGTDDISTRWLVQRQWPKWLGVGATTHFDAMASAHRPSDDGCAGCAHPRDDANNALIPTAAVISHWAGLILAAYVAREASGAGAAPNEQMTYCAPLRIGLRSGVWRTPVRRHPACPVHGAPT